MRTLILPEELRQELKAPLGILYRGRGVECVEAMKPHLKKASKIIAVGDMTTFYLQKASVFPHLMIVDGKTKRAPVVLAVKAGTDLDGYLNLEIENPPATLRGEFMEMIQDALSRVGRTRIEVHGEEDLAALPAIAYSPIGAAVVYGQPGEGSVLVQVTPERKSYIASIMERMIVEDE